MIIWIRQIDLLEAESYRIESSHRRETRRKNKDSCITPIYLGITQADIVAWVMLFIRSSHLG